MRCLVLRYAYCPHLRHSYPAAGLLLVFGLPTYARTNYLKKNLEIAQSCRNYQSLAYVNMELVILNR
jgi:hypothetical protein